MKYGLFSVAVVALLLPSVAKAQQPHFWQPTLETARRAAAQTNRLVLIYFCADWCQGCRAMEQEVLNQPNVAAQLQSNFVPVKVNADYFPSTAQQYGVTALPTTVVATAEGQALDKLRGRFEASQYVARLNQVAADAKRQGVAAYAQIPGGLPTSAVAQASPSPPIPNYQPPAAMQQPEDRYADYYRRRSPASSALPSPASNDLATADYGRSASAAGAPPGGISPPPAAQQPISAPYNYPPSQAAAQQPVIPPAYAPPPSTPARTEPPAAGGKFPPTRQTGELPPGNPPLGLDGYCPVRLIETQQWVMGDRRWGIIHRGRTYLFGGPEERNRFFADPDRYAPVLSGNDVVLMVDHGQSVPGCREHGVFFGSKVYLFADESPLQKFSQNANYYANQALQAMQNGVQPAERLR